MDPDTREYAQILSSILTRVGRLTDGIYYAKVAAMAEPHPFLSTTVPPQFLNLETSLQLVQPSRHYVTAARRFNLADYEGAFRECQAELRINSEHADAYTLLGRVAIVLARPEIAIGALQAAM